MKKLYRIITLDGSHEYDLGVSEITDGNKFTLLYSSNEIWTNPGGKIMSIEYNDDLMIKLPKLNRSISAADAVYLSILLKFISAYGQEKFADSTNYVAVESTSGYKI